MYQIAKNCRTSVKMIEDFYASHIKNMVDASVINVRPSRSAADQRQRRRRRSEKIATKPAEFAGLTFPLAVRLCPLDCGNAGVAKLVDARDLSD